MQTRWAEDEQKAYLVNLEIDWRLRIVRKLEQCSTQDAFDELGEDEGDAGALNAASVLPGLVRSLVISELRDDEGAHQRILRQI